MKVVVHVAVEAGKESEYVTACFLNVLYNGSAWVPSLTRDTLIALW